MELWPNSSASVNSEIVLLSTDRERADLNSFRLTKSRTTLVTLNSSKNISLATLSGIPRSILQCFRQAPLRAPADGSNK